MTVEKASELIKMHIDLGSGYNRGAVRQILADIMRNHSQIEVDKLIVQHNLSELWGFKVGKFKI